MCTSHPNRPRDSSQLGAAGEVWFSLYRLYGPEEPVSGMRFMLPDYE